MFTINKVSTNIICSNPISKKITISIYIIVKQIIIIYTFIDDRYIKRKGLQYLGLAKLATAVYSFCTQVRIFSQ